MTQRIGLGWLPLVLVSALGFSSNPCLPIWLNGATEKFQFTATQSGIVASLELGAVAIASILWGALSRSTRQIWPVLAVIASVLGNFLSFDAESATMLMAGRILTGLSYGIVLADITRRAAQMPNAHRVFAIQQIGLVAFVTIFFSTVPQAISALGPLTPFLYNVALGVAALVSLIWLPSSVGTMPADVGSENAPGTKSSKSIAMTMIVILLTFLAQSALWTYITPAAANAGVDLKALGQILAVGAMLSVVAPIAAERMGFRLGRTLPFIVGHGALILSILFVAFGPSTLLFSLGAVGINLFILFLMSFLLTTLADLDSSGRAASVGPAFFTIGGAIGPAMGGIIISVTNIPTLGIIATAIMTVAFVLALVVNSRVSASAKAAQA